MLRTIFTTTAVLAATTFATGLATAHPGGPVAPLDRFQSPSGNIACGIFDGQLRCDVADFAYSPPARPGSCDASWGHAIVLDTTGPARFACVSDTVADPGLPVLDYGTQAGASGFQCESSEAGFTCATTDGAHGFHISRTDYWVV